MEVAQFDCSLFWGYFHTLQFIFWLGWPNIASEFLENCANICCFLCNGWRNSSHDEIVPNCFRKFEFWINAYKVNKLQISNELARASLSENKPQICSKCFIDSIENDFIQSGRFAVVQRKSKRRCWKNMNFFVVPSGLFTNFC